jgi:hypothetical protein
VKLMSRSPQNCSVSTSNALVSERFICDASTYHLARLVILTSAIGTACSKDRLEHASERLDISAIERYAKTLSEPAGSGVTIERCAMFSGTRAGYCLVGLSQAGNNGNKRTTFSLSRESLNFASTPA